ncbi:MAG: type II toxin-antitoxin system mRNA interferase toxin, RelE/StbE family [Candidatus Levybacteria bacterium]|nr:type II toxin-antitoxin system mRNA interferase toxin, RelE/StbE family [Candidatus Levybacteria bacterium]
MKAKFSPLVQKDIIKIQKKNKNLADRIEKQIALFEKNPKHPSLRTHKLTGSLGNLRSISISMSIRMIYILLDEDTALFVKIGIHDEVYRR